MDAFVQLRLFNAFTTSGKTVAWATFQAPEILLEPASQEFAGQLRALLNHFYARKLALGCKANCNLRPAAPEHETLCLPAVATQAGAL